MHLHNAKRRDDKTIPCHIPHVRLKNDENVHPHLIHVIDTRQTSFLKLLTDSFFETHFSMSFMLRCDCFVSAKIGVFYLVFYSCLALFFAIMLAGFFATLDSRAPTQKGLYSLIKANPGKTMMQINQLLFSEN